LLLAALVGAVAIGGSFRALNRDTAKHESIPASPESESSPPPIMKSRMGTLDQAGEGRQAGAALQSLATTASPIEASTAGWGRRIMRRATIDLEMGDVEQGVAGLIALLESFGGFVGSTETQTDAQGPARATVTAYVPVAEFSRALASLDGLGRVTRRGVGGQDVSEEYVDLDARLRNLERHEARLLGFFAQAQKVPDLLALEGELARVRGQIEQATGRLRFLKARTDLATLQVALVRRPSVAPPEGQLARFAQELREAFTGGWSAALAWSLAVAVAAAQLSPLAVPALGGWLLLRRRASRRQARAEVSGPA
jgi:hypothetical protein